MHVAPTCAGFEEGSDHFGSYARNLFFLERAGELRIIILRKN
jgi:hypothetical protein